MRCLLPDKNYFEFLDRLREESGVNVAAAPLALIGEFPNLRSEEAKAICADWRATYHQRRMNSCA